MHTEDPPQRAGSIQPNIYNSLDSQQNKNNLKNPQGWSVEVAKVSTNLCGC